MALTVSSIVGNVSGHINNDRYNALALQQKTAVDQVMTGLNGIDWSQPQDLVNIIETKVDESCKWLSLTTLKHILRNKNDFKCCIKS